MEADRRLEIFSAAAPGLEEIAAIEMRALGIGGRVTVGGVSWLGSLQDLYAANLRLRTVSRVVVRVARFTARSFIELERHARRIDWSPFLPADKEVRLRISSSKSRLYHERAIEERFARFMAEAAGVTVGGAGGRDDEIADDEDAGQLFVIRFHRDECVVSADSSGALLHRRGYRQAIGKAPLRETLAAAMLLALEWNGDSPLIDPFCGSGTIPIEAALIAQRIAPGLANRDRTPRAFAFQRWPGFDADRWREIVERARAEILPATPTLIRGSDRDAGAIDAARQNAARAGVEDSIQFQPAALSAIEVPSESGWLVTNPPYGVRVGEGRRLRDLYSAIGKLKRDRMAGWRFALLSADNALEHATGLEWAPVLSTKNGGIAVRLVAS